MRKSFGIILILILLMSCHSQLFISNIQKENISNSPANFSPDSIIIHLVEPFKADLEEDMSRVISYAPEAMIKQKPESKLTNYLSDLLLKEGEKYCMSKGYQFCPQIAYVNYGGIRSSLPKGEITVGHIFEIMPFENEMVVLEISGENIVDFAAQIAGWGGDGVSGIKMGIKDDKMTSLKVGSEKPVSNKNYYLVTNDYVASGGGGMRSLSTHKRIILTGLKLRDLFIESIEQNFKNGIEVSSVKDGRIYYEE